jgi:heme/copper-type cytochrome/quinol oxidase subunit 1
VLVGDSKQYLILPGFGIISNVIASAAKKTIFGYLAMVYAMLDEKLTILTLFRTLN